jgi:hypothetical protein
MEERTPEAPEVLDVPNVLDLSDLAKDSPRVNHKGKEYPMAEPRTLGLKATARAQKLGTKFLRFANTLEAAEKAAKTPEESDEAADKIVAGMEAAIEEFLDIVLPTMPKEVRDDLEEAQKMAIMDFFARKTQHSMAYLKAISAASSQGSPSTAESDMKSS